MERGKGLKREIDDPFPRAVHQNPKVGVHRREATPTTRVRVKDESYQYQEGEKRILAQEVNNHLRPVYKKNQLWGS